MISPAYYFGLPLTIISYTVQSQLIN